MIPIAEPYFDEKELEYVTDCVKSGWVCNGGGNYNYIDKFEQKFAELCGTKYATSCTNGTIALHLALEALGIKQGDEVIAPNFTFVASINSIAYTGATPVLVDVDPITWCIDPGKIVEAVTDKTKAIMPVHLYGRPCDMDSIMRIADEYGLCVVEDSAHAEGVIWNGNKRSGKIGSFGDIGCFSFYGNKILVTGEGGMLTTNSKELYNRANQIKNHGMDPHIRYHHPIKGFNYRMANINAALGLAQIEKLDYITNRKRKIASMYDIILNDVPGITVPKRNWTTDVCWIYTVLIDEKKFGLSRDGLITYLKERGIETRPVFYPISSFPMYNNYANTKGRSFPVTDAISSKGISLPSSVNLTYDNIKFIIERLIGSKGHVKRATEGATPESFGFVKEGDEDKLWNAFFRCSPYTKDNYWPMPYTYDEAVLEVQSNVGKLSNDKKYICSRCEDVITGFGFIAEKIEKEYESEDNNGNGNSNDNNNDNNDYIKTLVFGIAIVDEYQGKGLGTKFVKWIIDYAKRNHYRNIRTSGGTARDGKLINILKEFGFEEQGEDIETCNKKMINMSLYLHQF